MKIPLNIVSIYISLGSNFDQQYKSRQLRYLFDKDKAMAYKSDDSEEVLVVIRVTARRCSGWNS
jgi:hypothetical protein